jgi:hypothetical protein
MPVDRFLGQSLCSRENRDALSEANRYSPLSFPECPAEVMFPSTFKVHSRLDHAEKLISVVTCSISIPAIDDAPCSISH